MKLLKRLFNEEEGVTLIEYALIAALIAVVSIAILTLVGTSVRDLFSAIQTALGTAEGGGAEGGGDL